MKAWLMCVLLGVMVCGTAVAEHDEEKINGLISAYEVALNRGDTNQILQLYASAPVFMPQHAPAMEGRESVRAAYAGVFEAIELDVEFTIHEIQVVGDIAWARTSSAGTTKILANNAVIKEGNNELFIFKKEKEQWRIHRYLFATNKPR